MVSLSDIEAESERRGLTKKSAASTAKSKAQKPKSRSFADTINDNAFTAGTRALSQGLSSGLGEEIGATLGAGLAYPVLEAAQAFGFSDKEPEFLEVRKNIIDRNRQGGRELSKKYPITTAVNEVGGSIAGGLALPHAAIASKVPAIAGAGKAALEAQKTYKGIAATGGLSGMLSGYGFSEGETATDVLKDTALGGALGATLSPLITAAGRGITGLPNMAKKQFAKFVDVDPQAVSALKEAGLPVSVAATTKDKKLRNASSAVSELFGGQKMNELYDNAYSSAENALKGLGFKQGQTPTNAGVAIKGGLERWREQSGGKFRRLDDAVKEVVPDSSLISVNKLPEEIKKLAIGSGSLTESQIQKRMSDPAFKIVSDLVDESSARNGFISMEALKEAKTAIGEAINVDKKTGKNTNFANYLYGRVSDAINDGAEQVGGKKARALMSARNKAYSLYMDEEKNYVNSLFKKIGATPEAVYNALTSGTKIGGTKVGKILSKVNPEESAVFRNSFIEQSAKDPSTGEMAVGRFFNTYRKLSDEAKDAIFPGELSKKYDTLSKAVQSYQEIGKFGNSSRTAYSNYMIQLLTGTAASGGLGSATDSPLGYAAGFAVPFLSVKASSKLLSSPKVVDAALKIMQKPDKKTFTQAWPVISRALVDVGVSENVVNEQLQEVERQGELPQAQTPSDDFTRAIDEEIQRRNQGGDAGPLRLEVIGSGDDKNILETPVEVTPPDEQSSIMQDEGLRLSSYMDTTGNKTVGYGFNMQSGIANKLWKRAGVQTPFADVYKGKASITEAEAANLYQASLGVAVEDAQAVYGNISRLSPTQQDALYNLSYNLGRPKLEKMRSFNSAVKRNDWQGAAYALLSSEYAKQVPNRAERIARALLSNGGV